jgi:CelD/BcsL family acetyltransferase involved in cellulose biosynthesis
MQTVAETAVVRQEIEIRVVDTTEMFESLREEWDAILGAANEVSVFVSWEWQYHWWRHYGKQHRLRILTAWENGRLTGILPLYIQTTTLYPFFRVNVVRFIGTGGDTAPDYLGPLLGPLAAERTARAFVGYMVNELHGWDVLYLSDLVVDSVFGELLAQQCVAVGHAITKSVAARIAYIALPPSWDDYLAGLRRDRRYTIRNTRRKFETQHHGQFYVRVEEDGIDEAVDRLIALHHRRWQAKSERHAFSSPEYVGFHRDVIHACARRGWIRFYSLEANRVPVAVFYCYRFRNQIFYFQAGFNPDYERLRPGLVLIGYAVEHAIREGNAVFDFLRGEHEYKTQWGKSMRETRALTAYRSGLGAAVYRMREERIPAVKRWIKRMFPFLRRDWHGGHGGHGTAVRQDTDA